MPQSRLRPGWPTYSTAGVSPALKLHLTLEEAAPSLPYRGLLDQEETRTYHTIRVTRHFCCFPARTRKTAKLLLIRDLPFLKFLHTLPILRNSIVHKAFLQQDKSVPPAIQNTFPLISTAPGFCSSCFAGNIQTFSVSRMMHNHLLKHRDLNLTYFRQNKKKCLFSSDSNEKESGMCWFIFHLCAFNLHQLFQWNIYCHHTSLFVVLLGCILNVLRYCARERTILWTKCAVKVFSWAVKKSWGFSCQWHITQGIQWAFFIFHPFEKHSIVLKVNNNF